MITTLTLNPCIDRTIEINDFRYGELNIVNSVREDLSGKGINVSICLSNLQYKSKVLGINYSNNIDDFEKYLTNKNITCQFITESGNVRVNEKLLDTNKNVMTELNQRGNVIEKDTIEKVLELVEENKDETEIMVLSGSVPLGTPLDIYEKIINLFDCRKTKIILDAQGELLENGIRAKPYAIKPNIFELEQSFNIKIKTREDMKKAARSIIDRGVEIVCLSLGSDGAAIFSKNEAYYCNAMNIPIKGIQGAGDSMVAGMCISIKNKESLKEMLTNAVACASASIMLAGSQMCNKNDYDKLRKEVIIEKI